MATKTIKLSYFSQLKLNTNRENSVDHQKITAHNGNDRARRCMVLGKALNRIAKDLYNMTRANVAVFSRSDQGREYQYSSHVAG